jgi:glyoxylase-like metal-dependent hydrolase (beta-lactamase superfamily II)
MSLVFETWTPHLLSAKCRGLAMNTGIVHDGEHAALIDPALYPDEIDDITASCASRGLHVETVIVTHHHWDHVLGAVRFAPAKIVTQQSYIAQTALELDHTRSSIRRCYAAQGFASPEPFEPPMPDQTVEHITGLMVGDLRVQVFHTPGHARDHLSVYDAESCSLWAGDMLSDLEIPFVSDQLDAYERTLGMFTAMDIRVLIPGHGSATADAGEIPARIAADRAYLAELRNSVQTVVTAGGTAREAASACGSMRFRRPDDNAGAHAMNVEQVFLELGGRAPDGVTLGWARE